MQSADSGVTEQKNYALMTDLTCIRVHRTSLQPLSAAWEARKKKIGRTRGALNCKLHIFTDVTGRPILMFLTSRKECECKGAWVFSGKLPKAKVLGADRGYDADRFRKLLRNTVL